MGDRSLAGLVSVLARVALVDLVRIARDSRLQDDFGIDSLAMVDLVCEVEDAFGVRIPDEDAERFKTVGDVADFLNEAK